MPYPSAPDRASVIVVAAGRGARMGAATNKVLLELDGVPILLRTLDSLCRSEVVEEIVVVTRPEDRDTMVRLCRRLESPPPRLVFADGGAERADSVSNGLAVVSESLRIVLVHDAARPFVSPPLIRRLVQTAAASGAAIPALPVADTLKRRRDSMAAETVDRSELVRAQTPQAFRVDLLRRALAARGSAAPTDDAAAVEAIGGEVALVDGDALNLKITTPDDLRLAHAVLPLFLERRAEDAKR